jgi:peptidyl-prolyl cis-trans isomerase B (cyclophilin B)
MYKNLFVAIATLILMASCTPKKELLLIETDYGNMKVSLYDSTPLHKENIKKLANEGYYDGTLFHRVIPGFMIQGGDPDSKGAAAGQRLGSGGPGYRVDAEIGEFHYKGTLAAARTGGPGNPEKKSSGSQFYIVQGKPVTAAQLDQMGKSKGITYSDEAKARYERDGGAPFLDGDYTVFGEVIEGMDVIDKIAAVQIGNSDRPATDVTMKVKVIKE